MSNFKLFSTAVHTRFTQMSSGELFRTQSEGLFEHYLAAFPEGANPIFRERTEHDCSCCKHFVRNIGHVVTINDGKVQTVWDSLDLPEPYKTVADKMAELVRQKPITGVFRTKFTSFGAESTRELSGDETRTWNHFHGTVAVLHRSYDADMVASRLGSAQQVLKRGLLELKPEALDQMNDLIVAGALYRGDEHAPAISEFRSLQAKATGSGSVDLFAWEHCGSRAARFRNSAIGTLAQDLSEGVDIERAVKSFEAKVAPQNYKRTTALITPKMIDGALDTLRGLGLEGSVNRRLAHLDDVSVNNVLWASSAAQTVMRDGLRDALMGEAAGQKASEKGAVGITLEDFILNVLPQTKKLELMVENRLASNFVALTTAGEDGGKLFKWGNDFAWAYEGDAADSIKKRVKAAGGNIEADVRISLGWSNYDDLDIHLHGPMGHIFHGNRAGILDVDMNISPTTREAVENLSLNNPKDGDYTVAVRNYTRRESTDTGFEIEMEFEGEFHVFSSATSPANSKSFTCLEIKIKGGKVVRIGAADMMKGGSTTRDVWGVKTEQLVPVSTAMLSPNHWDGQAIGNKHLFLFLDGCAAPDPVRGMYNEFLRGDLEAHRKVFEVLGAKTKCAPDPKGMAGIGFSTTRRDHFTVVAEGDNGRRTYNVKS